MTSAEIEREEWGSISVLGIQNKSMPFEAGKSGNPGGRPTERPWRDALRVALHETDLEKRKKKLLLLAEKTVDLALAGDIQAIREIGNRIDGMPQQQIEVNPGDDLSLEEKRTFAGLLAAFIAQRREAAGDAGTRH